MRDGLPMVFTQVVERLAAGSQRRNQHSVSYCYDRPVSQKIAMTTDANMFLQYAHDWASCL